MSSDEGLPCCFYLLLGEAGGQCGLEEVDGQ